MEYYNNFLAVLKENSTTTNFLTEWEYAGGDDGGRWNYFRQKFGEDAKRPPYMDSCICGHDIIENCYIVNKLTKKILVVGTCCIKRFLPERFTRKCSLCGQAHQNRKDNICNDCRGTNVFKFGKYKGKPYAEIFAKDPGYFRFITNGIFGEEVKEWMDVNGKSFPLITTFSCGKYKGKEFSEVKTLDPKYFAWAYESDVFGDDIDDWIIAQEKNKKSENH